MSSKKPAFQISELALPVYLPSFLFATSEYGLLPLIPASAQRLGADIPTAAFITGLVFIGTLIADFPAASIVNRFGERISMIGAAFIGLTGMLCAVFAIHLMMLGVGVFLLGVAAAIFGLARHAYIAERAPKEYRARSLSFLGGTFRAGASIGPLLGAWIIGNFGIENIYWMPVVLCAAAGIILLTTKPEKMPNTPTNRAGGVWAVTKLEKKKLLTLGVASLILNFLRTVRHLALPLWALHIQLDVSITALIIGVAGLIDFALFYIGGQVIDRYGRRIAAVPTTLAIGLGIACIPFTTDAFSFAVVAIALAFANALGSGLVLTISADLAPDGAKNEFLAAFRLMLDSGIAAAAPVIGLLTIAIGLSGGLIALSPLALLGGYLMNRYLPKYGIR